MTIEEAIEKEKSIAKSNHELANSYHTDFNVYMRQEGACRERAEYHEQVAEWLEELQRLKEQESVIDKIRVEIEQKCCITVARENDPAITLYDVFKIIDKYRTESEE